MDHSADVARIEALFARGEYLAAYDAATEATGAGLDTGVQHHLTYLRALALARTGATGRAAEELDRLDGVDAVSVQLGEDIAALRARIAKDGLQTAASSERADVAASAATAYESVFLRFGRAFACINAATLWQLAGNEARAADLAHRARELAMADSSTALSDSDAYWAAATLAESALIRRDPDEARAHLEAAARWVGDNFAAKATTRKQLRMLCEHHGYDAAELLAPIANPEVVHFCGHVISVGDDGRFPADHESAVRAAIERWIAAHNVGFAFGSLAAGADIITAEALLRSGAELNVVLPFDAEEFGRVSVAPSGASWVERYRACLAAASTVTTTCESAYLGDDELFGFGARVAMGEAINRSRHLDSAVTQLAVWDAQPTGLAGGTGHDVDVWRRAGQHTHVVPVKARDVSPAAAGASRRPVRALLFGDMRGFSELRDEQMYRFLDCVLQPVADVLDSFGAAIAHRNTWGDAIFIAIDSTSVAADAAVAIQDALARVDLVGHGLPAHLRMRLAAHVGPVMSVYDPVRHREGVFGRELTRTARIEPRTPPGEVYATSHFAALLVLDPDAAIRPEYIGTVASAKDFEVAPIYVLKRKRSAPR